MSVILTDKIQPRTTGIAVTVAGDLDVTGAVSVAGTITYEDVTNVDSVGLITARTGVRVTAGGVVVTAGVSTFTDDVKVNSTLTATEGIDVTAGVSTFAGNVYIKNTYPRLYLTDTDTNSDFSVINANGAFMIYDDTNSANRFTINSSGVGAFNSDLEVAGSQYITDSIIHTGDTNTKIRFPAADQVKIETAGGNRLHITENGKIGVGGDPTAYPGKFVVIGASGGASGFVCDREIVSRIGSGTALTERGFQQIIDGVEKFAVYPDLGGNFKLDIGSTRKNAITVTSAQDPLVGVGTTTPASGAKLHLHAESTAVRMQFTTTNTGISDSDGVRLMIDSSNNFEILQRENASIEFFTNNSQRAVLTNSGTLGINETSPDSNFKLHVDGMGKFTDNIAMNDGKMMYWGDSDTSFILGYDAAAGGYLAFGSNNERMRLQNNGYLGIGITNPTTKLYLHEGQFTVKSSGECGPYLYRNNGSGPDLVFHSGRGSSFTSPTASGGTDLIGNINFAGYDGSTYQRRATINGTIDGTVGSGNVPTSIAFKTGGSGVTTRMTVSSMGDTRLDSGNLIIKGGRSMDINSNSSWTTFFTFSSSSAVAFVCRFTATENSNTTGYVVTGSVSADQCTQAYMADTGHAHSKDILFRLDGTGNVNLQVKADQYTTTRRVRLIDCFVDVGHPTYA